MMMRARACFPVLLAALAWALFGCGGGVDGGRDGREEVGGSAAPATLVVNERSCETGSTPSAREATEAQDPSDTLAVVELFLLDECTGLGGHWVLARELDAHRRFFLGAHGCRLWDTAPAARFGVVRYRQTAGIRSTPEGACIAFAGERVVQTDQSTSGVVGFVTRADAESFATERGWKKR